MIAPTRRGLAAGMDEDGVVQGALAPETDTRQADNQQPARTLSEDDDDEEPNVSPEEQAAYEAFVDAGFDLIYTDGKVNEGILQMLDEDPADLIAVLGPEIGEEFSPVIALAATAVVVVLEVVRRAGEEKPDGEIIMHGGRQILEDLANLAKTAGLKDYTSEDLSQAMLHAVNLYRETAANEGMVDEAALTEEFAEILNAQEEGRLGEILPGIERYDDGAGRNDRPRLGSRDAGLREDAPPAG